MSGYTPGPWTQGSRVRTDCVWLDGHREPMVGMGDESTWIDCNTPANARLVAAALRLLSALKQAVTSMQDSGYPNSHVAVREARAAIAEATGEQP